MLSRGFRFDPDLRKRQIDTLKIFNDNVIEVKEGAEYKITFVSGGNELTLTVLLAADFPSKCPEIRISPVIFHPWVNSDGEVTGAPGLLNYTIHSDLGRIVQAIIRELERNPPPLLSNIATGVCSTSTMHNKGLEMSQLGRVSPILNNYGLPNYPVSVQTHSVHSPCFPDLDKMSVEELQFLNENEDRQDEFLDGLPAIVEMNKNYEELLCYIEELANSNLAKEKPLESLKTNILSKRETVVMLRNKCEALDQKYQTICNQYAPHNIKELLRAAAVRSDEESEQIAEQFLNTEMPVEKFLDTYLRIRALSHIRKTKEEKLAHQLSELQRAGF